LMMAAMVRGKRLCIVSPVGVGLKGKALRLI
jgi:hypothetical protein